MISSSRLSVIWSTNDVLTPAFNFLKSLSAQASTGFPSGQSIAKDCTHTFLLS